MTAHKELTTQEKLDILTTAIESGAIEYWASDDKPITITRNEKNDICIAEFNAEGSDGERREYQISAENIQVGTDRLLNGECRSDLKSLLLSGDHDSELADCIIQFACFGEIIYG